MSKTLQWVIGISVVVVSLAIVFAVVVPWVSSWFGWGTGYGMMGSGYDAGSYGMMGGRSMMGGGYGMMGGRGMMGDAYGSAGWMMGSGSGMMGGGYGMLGANGMMPWIGSQGNLQSGVRLTVDQARAVADDYAAAAGADFAVAEVMEFENNFYAVVEETSTGRGAFELLIDPYTGTVGPEPGPNMMWNEKYGHMAFGSTAADRPSMQKAQAAAQAALEAQVPGVVVHETGMSFYGYHTFDFDGPDGNIAGMVSVEDDSGSVWLHTWHGDFISEWEADEATS
jgi:hypothetical protein